MVPAEQWSVQLRISAPPSAEQQGAVDRALADLPVALLMDDLAWPKAPDGGEWLECSVGRRSDGEPPPEEVVEAIIQAVLIFPGTTWWSISRWTLHSGINFAIVGSVDLSLPLGMALSSPVPDTEGHSAFRWRGDRWLPVDLGAFDVVRPRRGDILVAYAPGQLNFTDHEVPTTELVDMFEGPDGVRVGRPPSGPSQWGQKGGAGGFPPVTIQIVLTAASHLPAWFVGGFVGAIGKVTFDKFVQGYRRLRRHREPAVAKAVVSLAALLPGRGWIAVLGPIDDRALERLAEVQLPPLPDQPFNWALEWEPDRNRWILQVERAPHLLPPLPDVDAPEGHPGQLPG
jgi:hypothetical protein